jgi:hypothetical protein
MIVIRNVFRCKPGQAKALVEKLKASSAAMESEGIAGGARVLTDVASTFWTVVLEMEAESLEAWESGMSSRMADSKAREAMEGYMDLVDGGHREIWKVE